MGGDSLQIPMNPVLATLGTAAGGSLFRLVFGKVIERLGDRRMERVALAAQRESGILERSVTGPDYCETAGQN
jgi:hypothetical protein